MEIPFTVEQFFDVFGTYNAAIWPIQVLAYVLGIVALALAIREGNLSARIVSGILGFFWIWMGVFYHILFFRVINPSAWIFGIFYLLQGLLFLLVGTIFGRLAFRFNLKPLPIIGGCFILYAMVFYPLLGVTFGHSYPRAPMFGVAPAQRRSSLLEYCCGDKAGTCLSACHSAALVFSWHERSGQLAGPSRLWTRGRRGARDDFDPDSESEN